MVKDTVGIEYLDKIDLRVGLVEKAESMENSNKLIRLTVDFGEDGKRNILTGLLAYYQPEYFEGGHYMFVLNLEKKAMLGEFSEGMLLCVGATEKPLPVVAPTGSKPGEVLK